MCRVVLGASRVNNHPHHLFEPIKFIELQFRSSWEVDSNLNIEGCVFHLNSIRLSTIVAFVADIIMFLIMLLGLYHLRHHHGVMGLGRFLWNQVSW